MKKQWLKPTLQLSAALLIVIVLLAVYTVPRPLTGLLFPGKEGWKIVDVYLKVSPKSKNQYTLERTFAVIIDDADKLAGLAELMRDATVVFRKTYHHINASDILYDVYTRTDMSHIPPRSREFYVIEGDNAIYIGGWGRSGGRMYKMNPRDYDRLIAILRTLAAEGTPVEPPTIIIEPEAS